MVAYIQDVYRMQCIQDAMLAYRMQFILLAYRMQFKIQSLDCFWSKLKRDLKASVCFDIPGGNKNRRREAVDLDPDAPMCLLQVDAAPANIR